MSAISHSDETCQVCGHCHFLHYDVLWPELTAAWQLTPAEEAYINVQQGTHCERCGVTVRSQALARAFIHATGGRGTLEQCVVPGGIDPKLLEINEAGNLTPWLSRLPRHVLARYPECDITQLPYPDGAFDVVVHSDTLEHVTDPDQGLRECLRVLAPGGACAFTVPVVVGRLTRDRSGLPASYHGRPECRDADFRVHTEFGADAWTSVFKAGFSRCELLSFRYPSGLAIVAWR